MHPAATLFALAVIAMPVRRPVDDWAAYTASVVREILSGASEDGVVFSPALQIRIGIHHSMEPNILGGVEGAPYTLVITRGFISLAERQLSEDDYRAILTHEVGHMILTHKLRATGKELENQEFAADQFARERLGQSGACTIAHALHRLAEPSGGWRPGSLERRRELFNIEICSKARAVAARLP